MEIWQAFLLGIVEGLTEFIPVSSTFHLIFASQFLNIENSNFLKFFEVFIQAGGVLAVLVLYAKELWINHSLTKKVIVSFIPTALISFLFYSTIKNVFFETNWLMLAAFILVGLIFIIYEWQIKKKVANKKEIADINWSQSLLIGLGQSLAILPGVSRSGVVILAMMLLGYKRSQAAKYSFLLALPTICAAAAMDLFKTQINVSLSSQEIALIIIGFITAFIVALIVLKWFISFLQKNTLTGFGIYRLVIGLALIQLL